MKVGDDISWRKHTRPDYPYGSPKLYGQILEIRDGNIRYVFGGVEDWFCKRDVYGITVINPAPSTRNDKLKE